jgi:hypothetical protein
VWHAALATGLQWLASGRESEVLPVFERHYGDACARLFAGEELSLPPPVRDVTPPAQTPMSIEERRAALRKLREETGV